MQAAIDMHLGEKYISGGNDCDIWDEKVCKEGLTERQYKRLVEEWGSAASTNAVGHFNNLQGKLKRNMHVGTNIVIQQPIGKTEPKHVMIACLNTDGTVDVAQCTQNPEDKSILKTFPSGGSEILHYKSEKAFVNDGWGELWFYYLGDELDYHDEAYVEKIRRPYNLSKYKDIMEK